MSPNATTAEVVGKIVYLRKSYHFGPQKISMCLKRYHDIQISCSGVWRILKRLEMSRLPSSQRYRRHTDRWKRYEKPLLGHRVQIDVKFIAPLKGSRKKHYQFTAIDDCTRIRVLRIYDRLNQKTYEDRYGPGELGGDGLPDLSALPTDPDELRAVLERQEAMGDSNGDWGVFTWAVDLISVGYMSPSSAPRSTR